jgi:hypothetical protein
MRVNGKQENITLDDLLECAGHMGIRKRPAMEIISEVRAGVSMWSEFAQMAGLDQRIASYIEDQLVSNNQKRIHRKKGMKTVKGDDSIETFVLKRQGTNIPLSEGDVPYPHCLGAVLS